MERGRDSTDKVLNRPLDLLISFSLALSVSLIFSPLPHPPCALQVEWVKEFRSETYSLSPHLLFWVWVPLSGTMAHSFLDPLTPCVHSGLPRRPCGSSHCPEEQTPQLTG